MGKQLIYNAILVGERGMRRGWVEIADGVITATGDDDPTLPYDGTATDAGGAYLIPGLTDTHVHFRDPGLTHKADITSESRAARLGGITAVFDMPNTVPPVTTADILREKTEHIAATPHSCSITPLMGLAPGAMKELPRLVAAGPVPAVKLFLGTTTGAMSAPDDSELPDIFRFLHDHDIPVIVHAEDNGLINSNMATAMAIYGSADRIPVSLHSAIRCREACLRSAARAVDLAHRYGTRLHLAHVSTADEANRLLEPGPAAGKLVTAETTALYLDPQTVERAATGRLKVNPAIKTVADAEALHDAVLDGRIDTIGTDHAPHLLSEKMLPGMTAMSGAPSIQFAVPVLLNTLDIATVVEKMTVGPRTVFRIDVSADFEPGRPADLSLVRKTAPYQITDSMVVSKCGWTPFAGITVAYTVEPIGGCA